MTSKVGARLSGERGTGFDRGHLQAGANHVKCRLTRAGSNFQHSVTPPELRSLYQPLEKRGRVLRPSVLVELSSLIERPAEPLAIGHKPSIQHSRPSPPLAKAGP